MKPVACWTRLPTWSQLLYRIARALLHRFVNSFWARRQALAGRSHGTPLGLSSRPPHTLQLEEYITRHFHRRYWSGSSSISGDLSLGVFVNVRQASSILDEGVKVRLTRGHSGWALFCVSASFLCWSYTFSVCGIEESWKIATCVINYCFHPSNIENARYEPHTPLCCPI